MNKMQKYIILVIVILLIIILSLLVTAYIMHDKKDEISKNEISDNEIYNGVSEEYNESDLTEVVQSEDEIYFSVQKNTNWNIYNSIQTIMKSLLDKDLTETFYNCLNEDYINNNQINEEYVNNLNGKNQNYEVTNFDIKNSYLQDTNDSKVIVFVDSNIIYNNNSSKNLKFAFETDYNFFDIEPLDDANFDNIINNKVKYETHNIKESDYNLYWETSISDEDICEKYFNDFITKLSANSNYVYNNLLSDKLKKNKFNNYDLFIQYMKNNIESLSNIYLYNISTNYNSEENNRYIILEDNFQNKYTLKENSILDYEITNIEKIENNE